MTDDLKERLLELCSKPPNATSPWPHQVIYYALARITDLEARLAAAEAEAKEQKADATKWFGVALENKHRAEASEAGEDALAEALTTIRDDRLKCPRAFDCRHIAAAALAAYEARRTK